MNQFNVPQDVITFLNNTVGEPGTEQNNPPESVKPSLDELDEVYEFEEDFDFDGFQVVRREFFAHLREPSVTFNNYKFQVNTACLSRFDAYDYAQVLINREKNILALRPCVDATKDTFQWSSLSKGKRKPRPITCRLFFAKIMSMMDWDPNHRYKILGNIMHSNGEYLLVFDLTAPEVYQRTTIEGQKPITSRTPVFPAEWQDQFGLPYSEHKKSMQINIVDGYAIYSVKEPNKDKSTSEDENHSVVSPELEVNTNDRY